LGGRIGERDFFHTMTDTIKIVDRIRHEEIRPLMQSLKAHIEISHNNSLHISPSVLRDVAKRLAVIESSIMSLVE
jgi:hypothetical protein